MSRKKSEPLKITKEFLLEIGGWRAMKEGRSLFESGKVRDAKYEPPLLHGVVQTGTSSVNARLHVGYRLSDVENNCSCRQAREYGTICPHVIAVGLAYLYQEKENGQNEPASSGTNSVSRHTQALPKLPTKPKLHVVPVDEATNSFQPLELNILLPLNLTEAWKDGDLRIITEGSIRGGTMKPLDAVPRNQLEPYAVSDADWNFLQMTMKLNGGVAPGMWILPCKDFGTFFNALIGHPRVSLGKKERIHIKRSLRKPELQLNLTNQGELTLHLEEEKPENGQLLNCSRGLWLYTEGTLEQLNELSPSYQVLEEKDVTIPRIQLGQFFQNELAVLERQTDLVLSEKCQDLNFVTLQPEIHMTLDGLLSGLSCRVEARYLNKSYVLQGLPGKNGHGSKPVDEWQPDLENPYRYFVRDRQLEKRVQKELIAAGFEPGKRQPEFYTLSSENRVGRFLGNLLPLWSEKWHIAYSPRLEGFLSRCDFIQPEVTVSQSGEDWLSVNIDYKEKKTGSRLSLQEVNKLLQTGLSHHRMESGRIALLPTETVDQFNEVIHDCHVRQENGSMALDKRFACYVEEAIRSNNWEVISKNSWESLKHFNNPEEVPIPGHINEKLRPYQSKGVYWIHHLARHGMCGILADEMGLGKTLQTLAFVASWQNGTSPGQGLPCLVICPTSLVFNWENEIKHFTPWLKALVVHGPKRKKLFDKVPECEVVVTSYALLRRDIEFYKKLDFKCIILDEAQFIKNRSSQNAKSVKALKAHHRLVLTGTPIENSLFDLWSIFDFLMPGYLGNANEFKGRYEVPIAKHHDDKAQIRLKQRLGPFILRRTKIEVASDLPERLEHITFCDLTEEQKEVYNAILNQSRKQVFDHLGQKNAKGKMAVLTALTRLRQVSCHLELLPSLENKEWNAPSSKMDYFIDLLQQAIDGHHRILVFSQFVRLLKLAENELKNKEIAYCYLDGSTVSRQQQVDKFQSDDSIPVFLISLKAGGTGMNLTAADTVIHFDPWWNPAIEDQATARAHRIGQTRIVNSYKLIAKGTVEEKIINLQKRKKELAESTLISEEAFVQNLTWEDLQGLLD
ncbi:MAG: SNF2-related protein [Verrucomicrobiota bacterium]